MARPARVVVVGSSNTDMVVRTSRIPAPAETVLGGDFMMVPGGKGANQAVAAARLGAHVTFVARVGTDVFGEAAIGSIAGAGVDTRYVVRDPDAPSGVALIFVETSGQNCIVVAPGANGRLSPSDVDSARAAFEAADVIVTQFEVPLETVSRAIDLAGELGKQIVVNPAPAQSLPQGFLRGVSVLTPNEVEAAMLLGRASAAGLDPAAAGRALLALGPSAIVATLGAEGAVIVRPDRVEAVPARAVTPVDTTAAGDCFTGALSCALGEGRDLGQAVRFASAAASISVTRMGAQTSMPSRAEVDALLQDAPR